MKQDDAVRRIGAEMTALSSFITVRVVNDRQKIARPFAIVFERSDEPGDEGQRTGRRWRALASMLRGAK